MSLEDITLNPMPIPCTHPPSLNHLERVHADPSKQESRTPATGRGPSPRPRQIPLPILAIPLAA